MKEDKPLQALIVEDNQINQLLTTRLLKRFSFEVDIAENGRIGVEKYKAQHFDLVLMDVEMPIMGGLEATRLIREHEQTTGVTTPIVALTANTMEGDKEDCFAAGMNEYMSKPVDSTDLLNTLKLFFPELKKKTKQE